MKNGNQRGYVNLTIASKILMMNLATWSFILRKYKANVVYLGRSRKYWYKSDTPLIPYNKEFTRSHHFVSGESIWFGNGVFPSV